MTWNKFLFEEFANLTAFECALIQTNFKIRASRTAFPAINQVCFIYVIYRCRKSACLQ